MKTFQFKFKNLLFLLMVGLAFTGCSSDDDGPGDPNDPDPQGNNPPIILDCNAFESNNPEAILLLENRSDGVDYIINCVTIVQVDLIIEPGVVIEFVDGAGIKVNESGSINAVGSQSEPILFTGVTKTKGAWKGIISRSQKVKNRFDYVTIDYAGDGGLAASGIDGNLIIGKGAYFRLNNVTLKNSSTYGLHCLYENMNVEFNNTTITGSNMPMYLGFNVVTNVTGGDFTGNTTDVIRLGRDGLNATTHTWKDLGVPYRAADNLVMVGGAILTIEPGVEIQFEDTKGVEMDKLFDKGSALIAVGTTEKPIIFTGVTKQAGSWKTIGFRRSTSVQNKVDNVLIEYAGGSGAGGAIEMWVDPVLSVTNTTFKDINGCALYSRYNQSNPNLTEGNNTLVNVSGGYMCGE